VAVLAIADPQARRMRATAKLNSISKAENGHSSASLARFWALLNVAYIVLSASGPDSLTQRGVFAHSGELHMRLIGWTLFFHPLVEFHRGRRFRPAAYLILGAFRAQ